MLVSKQKLFFDICCGLRHPSLSHMSKQNQFNTNENFHCRICRRRVFSFDSFVACRCNRCFQTFFNSACWRVNFTALTLSRRFKARIEGDVTYLRRDKVIGHPPPTDYASSFLETWSITFWN